MSEPWPPAFIRTAPPIDPVAGALLPISLDAATHAGLLRLAHDGRASLFMVLQAAFALTVGAFAHSADVTVATAVSGREHRLLDDLVGEVLAPAALELAAHRRIGGLGVRAPARRGGADVAVPNHIARADDHASNMPIMRTIRKCCR